METVRSPGRRGSLHARLETGLREAIRSGRLRAGQVLPSTRALAADLGVSRGVVVEAYAQLRAEGWLEARQGAPHRVAEVSLDLPAETGTATPSRPRHDLRPGSPDPLLFPRARWAAAMRAVLREAEAVRVRVPRRARRSGAAPHARLVPRARPRRARGGAGDVVVCSGVGHALALTGRALHAAGARRVAVEDPSHTGTRAVLREAGLEPVAAPVDEHGLVVAALPAADAVLVTPAHQFPTGAVLHPERRAALVAWARRHDAVILEDDYDAEYRYDRHPIGALQGLDPERVVYCGSVSKTLSPALRLGWAVSRRACASRSPRAQAQPTSARRRSTSSRSRASSSAASTTATCAARARSTAAAATHSSPRCRPPGGSADRRRGRRAAPRARHRRRRAGRAAAAERAGVGLATMGEHVIASEREPALILGYSRLGEPALRAAAGALATALTAR